MYREDALQTPEQQYKARRWDRMFVSRTIITSKAFLSRRTQGAPQVFLVFLGKCRYERLQGKTAKRKADYVHVNNGELRFSYREAQEEYGIPAQRFTRIIDKCGFHFWPDITRVAVETCLGKLDVASKTSYAQQPRTRGPKTAFSLRHNGWPMRSTPIIRIPAKNAHRGA